MKPRIVLVALALAGAALAAVPPGIPGAVSLTVARRSTGARPVDIAMATVPRLELEDWLGQRAGWDPVHVELEAGERGGLPTLRVTDRRGRVRSSLARPRDLTRARALLSQAMAAPAPEPIRTVADLEGVAPLAPGA